MTVDRAGDFGRKLRDARERKGISLRQIASATKISVSALEALERNDISRLPGGIFSRAFVRSYALEVGLDPETTIQEFIAQFPSDSVRAGHPTTDRVEDEEAVESDRQMASTTLRLVLIAVLYLGTAGRRFVQSQPSPPPAAETHAIEPPRAETPETPPERQPSTELPPSDSAGSPAAAAAATAAPAVPATARPGVANRLAVALAVTRPCWISATVDGEKKIERLLQPGDAQTIDVTQELVLTAGDASAVSMTLNGAEAKPLGKSGEVVTRRVNLTNYKDYLQTR